MVRLRLFLTVAAILAALMAFSAAPALAQEEDWSWGDWYSPWDYPLAQEEEDWGWGDWYTPEESSWDVWEDDYWGWDELEITETEWEDGTLELEGEATLWGEPVEVEFVCSDWWSCDLTDLDV